MHPSNQTEQTTTTKLEHAFKVDKILPQTSAQKKDQSVRLYISQLVRSLASVHTYA